MSAHSIDKQNFKQKKSLNKKKCPSKNFRRKSKNKQTNTETADTHFDFTIFNVDKIIMTKGRFPFLFLISKVK